MMRSADLLFIVVLAVALIPAAGLMRAGPQDIAADADSLEAIVRFLSVDPVTTDPRSRYVQRESELAALADALASRLQAYTGSQVERQEFQFTGRIDGRDSTFTAENIICRLEAAGSSSGVFLVTAHFDAIARRSHPDDWDSRWVDSPAPGADDNATGVAAVLEAARILSAIELPFDVEFVLFSAEELGKYGSEHYVGLCDGSCAESHLGMINADMIGYSGSGAGASVMSDFRSGWLAEMLIEYAADTDPGLDMLLIKPGPSNWDHAPFWERQPERLAAVTLSERLTPVTGSIIYPDYHTTGDLVENVDFDQTGRIASLINGFLASFSGAPPECSMLESDLLVLVNGAIRFENVFQAGEAVSVMPRVRNTGGSTLPGGASIRLEVWLENSEGSRRIYSGEMGHPEPLRYSSEEIVLGTGSGLGGWNAVTAIITVTGMDDDPSDNRASASFVVEGTGEDTFDHHFSPNPIDRAFREAMFCVNTAEESNMSLEIFAIDGESLGKAMLGSGYGRPVPAGLSCHSCGDLFPGISSLVSGIYLYRIVVAGEDGVSRDHKGRFAVER